MLVPVLPLVKVPLALTAASMEIVYVPTPTLGKMKLKLWALVV